MNVGLCNRIYVDYEVDNPVRPVSRAEQRMFMEQTGSVAYVICGLAYRHALIQGSIQDFLHSLEDEFLGNFDHIQVSPAVVVYENGGVVYAMVTLTGVGAATAAQALCGTFTEDENNPIPHPNDPGGLAAIRQFGCRTIRMQYGRERYHPTTEVVLCLSLPGLSTSSSSSYSPLFQWPSLPSSCTASKGALQRPPPLPPLLLHRLALSTQPPPPPLLHPLPLSLPPTPTPLPAPPLHKPASRRRPVLLLPLQLPPPPPTPRIRSAHGRRRAGVASFPRARAPVHHHHRLSEAARGPPPLS